MTCRVRVTEVINCFALAGLVLNGFTAAWARQPAPHVEGRPVSTVHTAFPNTDPNGALVSAVVRKINPRTGLIDLETRQEKFYAVVSPEDAQKLHEGDVVIVYVAENSGQPTIKA
jgi:hypothetical protein